MRSVIVERFGDESALKLHNTPVPNPGPGEIRIKVKVAGINYADIMQREGLYPGGPKPPYGAGFEVSGTIDALGEGVTRWNTGDPVMAFCAAGYSDFVLAREQQVLPKPESLGFQEAAAIPCQYLTAYHALRTLGRLQAGQTVLIQAAAGGLGTLLVQVARNTGATVIGTASTADKISLIRDLGCAHPINYLEEDFLKRTLEITGGAGCDLVIESVGGEVFDMSLACLRSRGTLVTLGVASKSPAKVDTVKLLAKNWTVAGFHLTDYTMDAAAMMRALADLHLWLDAGSLQIRVNHAFPLEEAAEAHRMISARQTSGKVVLDVDATD